MLLECHTRDRFEQGLEWRSAGDCELSIYRDLDHTMLLSWMCEWYSIDQVYFWGREEGTYIATAPFLLLILLLLLNLLLPLSRTHAAKHDGDDDDDDDDDTTNELSPAYICQAERRRRRDSSFV